MKSTRAHRLASFFSTSPFALVLASAALFAVNACASDEELGHELSLDGGSPDATDDASTVDADVDVDAGGADADVDAAPRTCTDQGFCHVPLPEPLILRGVWGDGTGVAWAVAEEGKILRWDGSAWTVHATLSAPLFTIWGSSPTDIYVGGEGGIFHGAGPSSSQLTFTPIASESGSSITSIQGFGPNDVWAVGSRIEDEWEQSRVLHYTGPTGDSATEWQIDPVSEQGTIFSRVWGSSADDVWIGGNGSVLRGSSDGAGGTSFTSVLVGSGIFNRIYRVAGGAALDEVFVVGENRNTIGFVWIGPREGSEAAPRIFTGDDFGTGYGINAVWGRSKNDAWIAGNGGRVWHWDGTSWSVGGVSITKFPLLNDLHAMWGSPNGDLWIVGDRIALRKGLAVGGDK